MIAERIEQRFFTPSRERLGTPAWEAAQAAGARHGLAAVDAALPGSRVGTHPTAQDPDAVRS